MFDPPAIGIFDDDDDDDTLASKEIHRLQVENTRLRGQNDLLAQLLKTVMYERVLVDRKLSEAERQLEAAKSRINYMLQTQTTVNQFKQEWDTDAEYIRVQKEMERIQQQAALERQLNPGRYRWTTNAPAPPGVVPGPIPTPLFSPKPSPMKYTAGKSLKKKG